MKYIVKWAFVFSWILIHVSVLAQEKKSLTPGDMPDWKNLKSAKISNNGKWVTYEVNPNVGDGILYVKNPDTGIEKQFDRGYKAKFSPKNNYVVFMIKPHIDSLRKVKLDELPKSKWPQDTLAIYVFDQDTLMKFDGIKSFKISREGSDWLAFQYKKPQKSKPPVTAKKKKKKKKSKKNKQPTSKKKPIKRKTSDLVMFNPVSSEKKQIKNVIEYSVSKYGNSIGYIRSFGDTIDSVGVYWYNNLASNLDTSYLGLGNAKKPTFSDDGQEFVWIHSADTGKAKAYSLYSTRGAKGTRIIIDTNDRYLPEDHTVSENGDIYFSRDGSKIFFGTALRPVEEPKDSIPKDEKSNLDVWSWTDIQVQPMQLLRKSREEKKTYLAVFHIASQKVVPLANDSTSYINPLMDGDNNYALIVESKNYDLSMSWAFPFARDYYRLNLQDGKKKLIGKAIGYNTSISPSGKYFVYFDGEEGVWYALDIDAGNKVNISNSLSDAGQILVDMDAEIPTKPFAYGVEGWTESEEWILIKTKFDIWKVDPKGGKTPEALTNGMADEKHLTVDFVNFDRDHDYVKLDSVMLLKAQNLDDNSAGLLLRYLKAERITNLVWGEESFFQVTRARETSRFFYRAMNFVQYPDIIYSSEVNGNPVESQFNNSTKISNVQSQQDPFYWGFVKKHYWKDENGVEHKGLLYYPENFDVDKKYPVMIYFYEKYFSSEYQRKPFRPSHSTIAIPLYTSNGYLVFVPDIHYGTGHPGKDGLNAVVSGAKSLQEKPYVDASKMAIQGQSWGGYQVAYIVTQTNMFAAAMAGAPVSNMTSAYGGIRWGSGMSREFQYERAQSRIGQTLWDAHDLYIENSPLFHIPNVKTPLLIMHNDNDGAVPYYQGIEMFMGMRRLQKPAWLLVYNKEQHNLRKMPNRLDLSLRMFQFFNFYLKGEAMPKWMKEGVPAIDKGKDYGFELEGETK
jgi:dipeptidyl aminopeptidase/acylaminoacyl peptidase